MRHNFVTRTPFEKDKFGDGALFLFHVQYCFSVAAL
jgi:hypothetical protein